MPVAGLLVAGLIGAAEACYYETSYVCVSANTQVAWYDPSLTGHCGGRPVYASTDWIGWLDWYTAGGEVLDYDHPQYCAGPAYFTDCKSSQTVNLDNVTDAVTDPTYRVAYGAGCY
jgi:hypothetical protein